MAENILSDVNKLKYDNKKIAVVIDPIIILGL